MSIGAVSSMANNGLLAQLVADSNATQKQLDKLTQQSASGQVADTYGGLGNAAAVSIDLRPQMAQVSAWQQNISTATGTLSTTQSVLGQLESIATNFSTQALSESMQSSSGVSDVAIQAKSALQQVTALLNTQVDGQYTFAGTDSTNPPVSAANLDTFTNSVATQVVTMDSSTDTTALVNKLVTQASKATFAYPGSSANGTSTPSAMLTPIGEGENTPTAFIAGVNSFAPQTTAGSNGITSTGSYVRDLVAGLAALAGLTASPAPPGTLETFGVAVSQLLQGANTAIANEEAGFGELQSKLTTQSSDLSDTLTNLTTQVSGAENVNMAATATALAQVQTQLQASFQLIAGMKQLTLTTYL